jgi:hypothetical protein
MYDLFARTLSQGLQAFMPIAVCAAWLRRNASERSLAAVRWAVLAAIPLTVVTGWLFQKTPDQARWQSLLAIAGSGIALALGWRIWRLVSIQSEARTLDRHRHRPIWQVGFGGAALLIIVRQTMEIAAVVGTATIEMRSLAASEMIVGSAALAAVAAGGWVWFSRRLSDRAALHATKAFAALFLIQIAFYAVHKSAEARFLPWGEALDVATEPYGPDSVFGYNVSVLLVALPLAVGLWSVLRQVIGASRAPRGGAVRTRRATLAASGTIAAVCVAFAGMNARDATPPRTIVTAAPSVEASTIVAAPHVLFRETGIYKDYGQLSVAPLATPGAGRAASRLSCERVSFAAGLGICLQADRGVLTTYKAVIFDERFQARAPFKLDGSPSRTRVSADGRVGAITVFLTGQVHGYSSASFSTKTILLDMATGDVLADLEKFTTWRDGVRFRAPDFNFWGVTFARESNTFYATLLTAGKRYLVRGDLGLRKLTVLHENVECPSLSPDNRLIAFKKKVGGNVSPWRFYVLELATMKERAIAGESSADDQIEWFDDTHVLYAAPRSSQSATMDVWIAAIDGSEPSRVFLPEAESPVVVR